ncbi:non-ribosomal peptide synthetase [Kitasatospora cineracea]|uniref:Amino acid adenylation domain-containing protein n=1 Tax=Kitasatospora cineracea TaxID=88074 RepID=A0A3N4R825_9ACTN|nr:non-ribosomal peptide synthetase [Kitasatospora cineracea]RPE29558.1 amino acid adenylation domain-containing protein [Kitasatospora cineracea]
MTEQVSEAGGGLSSAQRRLWLAHVLEPGSAEYTAPWAGRLRGPLDRAALARAWRAVVERHEELRLRLFEVDNDPRRAQWPAGEFGLAVREVAPQDLPAELERVVTRPFDLVGGRLAEAELLVLGPEDHVLVLNAHHAVVDGRSMTLITRDLFAAYAGREPAPAGRPYPEHVAREAAAGPPPEQFDAWVEELRLPQSAEPLGFEPAARTADKAGAVVRVPLSEQTWAAVRRYARQHRTTPQVVGLSAFALTLARYTDTDDLVVGSTMDTRSAEFVDTVGMFVNPAAVRVHVDAAQPGPAFCGAVQRGLLRAFSHRSVPFEEVVRRLQTTPDVTRTPVFQVLFNFEAREAPRDVPGLTVTPLELPTRTSKYDLTLVLRDNGDCADLLATYRTARYRPAPIEQLTRHVAAVLGALTADDPAPVGSLDPLSAAERADLLAAGRGTPLPDGFRAVSDTVAQIALADPDRPAVTCGSSELTYGQLLGRADALAARLTARGVRPGTPVAVPAEPSAETVVAVLAVLRAGGAYLPLHPGHPTARLAAVLADAGAEFVLADAAWRERLPQATVLPVDAPAEHPDPAWTAHRSGPDDPAYLIYTSGTTGEPKGVEVGHGALAASTTARLLTYGGYRTFLLVSPLSFDSSAAGLWGTLTSGGRLVVARDEEVRDPESLLRLVETHAVTALLAVPALYAGMLDRAERADRTALGTLDVVTTAGEVLPQALLERHFALLPATPLVNEYGPTEATVWSTFRRFEAPGPVDIGGPVPGARLYVLDRQGRLMPPGTAGELHVGGRAVARGYLGRPGATEAAFRPDPYAAEPGARSYRTGDWVRWGTDGGLHYLGRRDQLVKVRGHRVELGAVEAALRAAEGVTDAAVLLAPGGASLTAHLVAEDGLDLRELRARLAETLPPAMVPGVLRTVPELPRTPHGKVDREALRAAEARTEPDPEAAAPGTAPASGAATGPDLRALVLAAWTAVLGEAPAAGDVNFFDAGGHSLLVPLLQMELEDRADTRVPIVDLFTATTVDAQAALIAAAGGTPEPQPEAPAPAAAAEPGGADGTDGTDGTDRRRLRLAAGRSRRTAGTEDGR